MENDTFLMCCSLCLPEWLFYRWMHLLSWTTQGFVTDDRRKAKSRDSNFSMLTTTSTKQRQHVREELRGLPLRVHSSRFSLQRMHKSCSKGQCKCGAKHHNQEDRIVHVVVQQRTRSIYILFHLTAWKMKVSFLIANLLPNRSLEQHCPS